MLGLVASEMLPAPSIFHLPLAPATGVALRLTVLRASAHITRSVGVALRVNAELLTVTLLVTVQAPFLTVHSTVWAPAERPLRVSFLPVVALAVPSTVQVMLS